MALQKFIIKEEFKKSNSPFITITPTHIIFSVGFVNHARLDKMIAVEVHFDIENLILGFEFFDKKTDDDNRYRLVFKKQNNGGIGYAKFSNRLIVSRYKWVAEVSKLNGKDRRFIPEKIRGVWEIKLCPAFELVADRDSDIPSHLRGIYRYRTKNREGEIVYIGKGVIRDRLNEDQRKDWYYDVIEYSVIPNLDDQLKWECYWISRFKEDNGGKLPYYNKISGSYKHCEEILRGISK